jgi:ABC-type multidrug transport system ATPase subunit
MKINKLYIEKKITDTKGLEPIKVDRLGKVVALFGKNGSGKSRILDLLPSYISNISINKIILEYFTDIPDKFGYDNNMIGIVKDRVLLESKMEEINFLLELNPDDNSLNEELKKLTFNYNNIINNILDTQTKQALKRISNFESSIKSIIQNYITVINIDELLKVESDINNTDPTLTNLLDSTSFDYDLGEDMIIKKGALYYLTILANKLTLEKLKCKSNEELMKNKIYINYLDLAEIINSFLGKNLTHITDESFLRTSIVEVAGIKGEFLLDNRKININEFSPGQKILFAFCFYLYIKSMNKNSKLKDKIFIIDEIETHLHPEIQIVLIDKLKEIINDTGQLWIATHSINILSHLSLDEIYLVENGEIMKPGSVIPEKAYHSLMGNDTNKFKLNNFILDISIWAFSNFMIQCFETPDIIISAKDNDPQIELFKKIIKSNEPINLLDYGAGKGRLYKEISKDTKINSKIIYSAVEQNQENIDYIKKYGIKNVMRDIDSFEGFNFDLIIMINVLHEMNIENWEKTFIKIEKCLNENGLLIIMEDKFIPKGEMPNETGFLILGLEELQKLFKMKVLPSSISSDQKDFIERILCAIFSKEQIKNIDKYSVIDSMKCLRNKSFENLLDLRKNKSIGKIKKGHLSALYTQLHVNSKIALKKLNHNE